MSIKQSLIIIFASLVFLMTPPADAASKRALAKQFEIFQAKYASAIRWNEFEMAWGHVDPGYRTENPLSDFEKERFKLIQVTGYESKSQETLADGSIELYVEIRLVNRSTQAERIVTDTQIWRWDEKIKRWWLTTGLPSFAPKSF